MGDIPKMATPTAGLVEIILSGTLQGRPWANVFHYWNQADADVLALPPIADEFNAVPNNWATNVVDTVTFDNIKVKDVLGDLPDYDQAPTDPTGALAQEGAANFIAVRFDYGVGSKETRRGYKRLVGISEQSIADGTLIPGAVTSMQSFADTYLDSSLSVGGTTYTPVVVGGPTIEEPERLVANPVTSVTVQPRVTSQVSRK